ncbi:acyloxyacyl hydrolase [Hymenobacter puniceus]|uniref:acyloxyacyl hydrolase n=1 Tax=Hymenobacter sp. BT190 TaxID=2763505 RepID=UPI0016515D1F|nr:acyloxyacyl hydrolase [Hymenobacter sp. BT190]MBC6697148.1 acyloxyacyl hydrolase [Hymenobacter sp. BT190]
MPFSIRLSMKLTGALLAVLAGPLQAQVAPPGPLIIGAYAQGSFILAHTPAINHLAVSHPTGLELNLQRQLNGSEPWHAWYRYPKIGMALVYYDYHNPVLGRSYASTIYLNKRVLYSPRRELNFRLGTGLAYFTNPFDLETNHKNTIVSSRLNAVLQMRLEYDMAVAEHLGLLVGLGLNHYSNGATTKPNFGINLPTVFLGLNYHQQRPFVPLAPPTDDTPTDLGQNFLNLSSSLGFKQRSAINRQKYLVHSVSVLGGRRIGRKSNLLVGLEGFYDRSLLAELRDTARTTDHLPDVKKAGAIIGHELLFGRLAVVTHLGFYLYNPYKSNKFYYERIGLKYHVTDRLFGAVDLKVHRGSADVIEWKLGVKL